MLLPYPCVHFGFLSCTHNQSNNQPIWQLVGRLVELLHQLARKRSTCRFSAILPDVVMVFEVLGENLLHLIMKYDYKGIPIAVVKDITRQVLIALDYLHRELKIIHTDVKAENVVVACPQKAVQKAMEKFKPPADRFKQLTLAERDPSTLSKAQKKRLRKKLKTRKDGIGGDAGKEDNDNDDDNEDADNRRKDQTAHATGTQDKNKPNEEDEEEESLEESLRRYSNVKLVDFGNACWTFKHFTSDIQTRQYRAPEVIVRNSYDTSADIWSCAALVFELLTGDFLFDPQESEYIDRDEDHLALIVELLQTQPVVPSCLYAKGPNEYISNEGHLRHINHLKFWDLQSVLREKYKYQDSKAAEIARFLLPMLAIDPERRATAQQMLQHPWLEAVENDWDPYSRDEHPRAAPNQHEQDEDEEWEDEESEDGDDQDDLDGQVTLPDPPLYAEDVADESDGPRTPTSASADMPVPICARDDATDAAAAVDDDAGKSESSPADGADEGTVDERGGEWAGLADATVDAP